MLTHITDAFHPNHRSAKPTWLDGITILQDALHGAPGSTRAVYHWLEKQAAAARANGRNTIVPSVRVIARSVGYCVRTVYRALADLDERRLLDTEKRFKTTSSGARQRLSSYRFLYRTAAAWCWRMANALANTPSATAADLAAAIASLKARKHRAKARVAPLTSVPHQCTDQNPKKASNPSELTSEEIEAISSRLSWNQKRNE